MKSFLFSLLPLVQAISYSKYIQEQAPCQTPIRYFLQVNLGLNLDGSQGKPSKSAYQLLLLMILWRSPDALTVIQLLRLKFWNLLNHWLSSPQNKISPNSCDLFREVLPLTPLTVLGAIQMLDNFMKPVNKTGVPLHILGGM